MLRRLRSYHVARAVTLTELEQYADAAEAYRTALALPGNAAETDYLAESLAGIAAA